MIDYLTPKYVETALRAVAAEHPDRINPFTGPDDDDGFCAYTGPDGSHCIAGQFLANEGFLTEDGHSLKAELVNRTTSRGIEGRSVASALDRLDGNSYLGKWDFAVGVQGLADGAGDPRPWSEAIAIALQRVESHGNARY